jgi:hypothetical protein
MNLLTKFLEKRGLDPEKLSKEEKERRRILSEGEITVPKVLDFCNFQIRRIESQFRAVDNSKEKNEKLVLQHAIYGSIRDLIAGPQAEKEALEKYLTSLI